jgi:hypothetical protein
LKGSELELGDETDMNYIREINAFYDWLETNELSTSAISLWYALMHINNKTGWKNEFTVALSVLSIKTGLSSRAVTNARKELTEKGRIKWESRNGNQAAQYTVNSLVEELQEIYADKVADNATGKQTCKPTDKVADISSTLTKRKLNVNENNIYTPEFEEWYSKYPRPQAKHDSFKNFEKVRKEHGLETINKCTQNYLTHFKSLPEDKKEFAYASNNFFGQKAYFLNYIEPPKIKYSPKLFDELGDPIPGALDKTPI